MKLILNIEPDLAALWQPVIEHQCNLTLAPMVASLSNPKVSFTAVTVNGQRLYRCELSANLINGPKINLTSEQADGRAAIGSVFLRARRDVARRRRALSASYDFNRRAAPAPLR